MAPYTKAFSVDDIPNLSGKVIIVTGGATGIGKETALQLLSHNATVYIASRSRSKFDDLVAESSTNHRTQNLCFLSLDLSSMVSCVEAAREFLSKEKRLDVVVANAAVSVVPGTLSKDGVEIQFATNHLGHFVFIHHLLDIIKATSVQFNSARIVIVASHAHSMLTRPLDFNDLTIERPGDLKMLADVRASLQRYARSKVANILYARTLHAHLRSEDFPNIYVNCLNPGTMGPSTGTPSAPLPPWLTTLTAPVVYLTSIPAASGALTSLLLATDPDVVAQGISGRYFDVGPLAGKFWYGYSWDATDSGKLSGWARDEGLGEELWGWSLGRMRGVMGGNGEGD